MRCQPALTAAPGVLGPLNVVEADQPLVQLLGAAAGVRLPPRLAHPLRPLRVSLAHVEPMWELKATTASLGPGRDPTTSTDPSAGGNLP